MFLSSIVFLHCWIWKYKSLDLLANNSTFSHTQVKTLANYERGKESVNWFKIIWNRKIVHNYLHIFCGTIHATINKTKNWTFIVLLHSTLINWIYRSQSQIVNNYCSFNFKKNNNTKLKGYCKSKEVWLHVGCITMTYKKQVD